VVLRHAEYMPHDLISRALFLFRFWPAHVVVAHKIDEDKPSLESMFSKEIEVCEAVC